MTNRLLVGSRVRVLRDPEFGPGPWPAEPSGTITGVGHQITGQRGTIQMYLVQFDEPQLDTDGDGPYVSAEVADRYLRRPD